MQCSGAQATVGPVLVGLNHPVNIVAPNASVADIVMTAAMTACWRGRQSARRCRH